MAGVELATAYVSLVPSAKNITSNIAAEMGAPLQKAGKDAGESASKSFGETFKSGVATAAKLAAVGIGVGIAAFAGLEKIGSSFDDVSDHIRTTTGATGSALDGLQADFRNVVKNVPVDFGDAGDAIAGLNQKLGLTGAPLEALSTQVLNLSRITHTDLNTNVQSAADLFNSWGTSAKDQGPKLDELFRVSQATGISVGDLAQQMTQGGPKFRAAGLSFEATGSLLGLLAKNGLSASDVLPALAKSMATAAKEGKDAKTVFRDTFDAIKNAPDDTKAAGIALDVFGAKAGPQFAALIREGKLSYEDLAASIAGGGDTINKAASDTDDWREKLKLLTNRLLVDLAPVATKVFDGITSAVQFVTPYVESFARWLSVETPIAIGVLKGWVDRYLVPAFGAISVAAIAVGRFFRDTVWPILQRVFADIVGAVTWVVDWVRAHWGQISAIAMAVASFFSGTVWPIMQKVFAAVVAGVTWVVNWVRDHWSQISKSAVAVFDAIKTAVLYFVNVIVPDIIGGFKAAFGWLMDNKEFLIGTAVAVGAAMVGMFFTWASAAEDAAVATTAATWPILAIGVAIGGAVAGVLYAYNHFKTFHDIVDTVGRTIKTVTGWLLDHKAVLIAVGAAIALVVAPIPTVVAALIYAWTHFQTFRDVVMDVVHAVQAVIETVIAVITDLWQRFGDDIVAAAQLAWGFISGIVQAAVDVIVGIFDFFRDLFTGKWGKLWGDVQAIVAGVWLAIQTVIQATIDAIVLVIQTAWDTIKLAAKLLWDGLKLLITGTWDAIKLVVSTAVDAVVGFITGIGSRIAGFVSTMFDGIKTGITDAKNWVSGKIDEVVGFVQAIPGRMFAFVGDIFHGIKDAIDDARKWVGEKIDDVVGFATGLPGRVAGIFEGMWDGIKNAFKSAINWILRGWNGLHFTLPSIDLGPLGSIGGWTIGVPQIPYLAKGAIVESPIPAIIGDAPGGEAVLNKPQVQDLFNWAMGQDYAKGNPEPAQWPDTMTVYIEGTPFTAIVQKSHADLAGTLRAGQRR